MAPDASSGNANNPENSNTRRLFSFTQQIDFWDIGRILWRQIWVVAWLLAFVLLAGAAVVFSLTPRYTASAFVEVNPSDTNAVNFEAVLAGRPVDSATMETEAEILRSRKLAERAVEKLGLSGVPEFNPSLRSPSVLRLGLSGLASQLGLEGLGYDLHQEQSAGQATWYTAPLRSLAGLLSPGADDGARTQEDLAYVAEHERSGVVDAFLERLQIRPQGRSRVIGIYFRSEDPRIAANAANTLADLYIVAQMEAKFEAAKRANAWLNERITALREEVLTAERAVEEYRSEAGLIQGETKSTLTGEQVSELNAQYIKERTHLAEAMARLRQAENLLRSDGVDTAGEVLNSETIRDLRREESAVVRRVAELSNEYGSRHPTMINARAQLTDIQDKIKLEINKIIQSMRNEVAVARARTRSLQEALRGLKGDVAALNAAEVRLRHLEREAAASRQLLEQLLARSKEMATQTDFQQPDATVITEAEVPNEPTYPKTTLLLALLFVLGSGVGITGAFFVDRLDHGYRSADEITWQLGVAGLGLIPSISKFKRLGKAPPDYCVEHPTSAYGEALRSLYTNLLLSDVGNRPSVVLVASALPNEGKTSLVVSLARHLSSVGQDVVVVDCDLRRPSVHRAFGAKEGPGLSECVNGRLDLADVVQRDNLSSAHFVRAGAVSTNSPSLLDSVGFQQLLKTLSRNYDMVLLDSAPVLAVSDTLFLGRLAHKTILVVRWASTPREKVELALKKLTDVRASVAGVLLSMVDIKGHAQYRYSDSGTYHGALRRYYAD